MMQEHVTQCNNEAHWCVFFNHFLDNNKALWHRGIQYKYQALATETIRVSRISGLLVWVFSWDLLTIWNTQNNASLILWTAELSRKPNGWWTKISCSRYCLFGEFFLGRMFIFFKKWINFCTDATHLGRILSLYTHPLRCTPMSASGDFTAGQWRSSKPTNDYR